MRRLRGYVALLMAFSVFANTYDAAAIDATPPPETYYSQIYITAFQTSQTTETVNNLVVPTDSLDIIELKNDTDKPIDLAGWSINAQDSFGTVCSIELASWILPNDFALLASSMSGLQDPTGNVKLYDECTQLQRTITSIELTKDNELQDVLQPSNAGAYGRKSFTKTYRTGSFEKDFALIDTEPDPSKPDKRLSFYAGEWYEPQGETSLQISEILARSSECSPLENNADCTDYIKLYNPTSETITLDNLRVRVGYQGQNPTSSNTVSLSGEIMAGEYGLLMKKDDGNNLSIANDGGYIWLEDKYGTTIYDNTVVEYPSASSVTKIGWAWAYNIETGDWQWTSTPTPYNQPSVFTGTAVGESVSEDTSSLKPCRSDQFRNPLTNRCKLIESSSSSLTPCSANQYRNPATNRCKSLSSSTSSLTPCKPGQYRNPATNRCKSATAASSSLKPCAPNQERNPATNRCRNEVANISADFPVETVADTAEATVGWWAFGGVGMLAAGYAGWEWRNEAMNAIKKMASFTASGK